MKKIIPTPLPPEILLIFNIPNYSLDYFTTMKLF